MTSTVRAAGRLAALVLTVLAAGASAACSTAAVPAGSPAAAAPSAAAVVQPPVSPAQTAATTPAARRAAAALGAFDRAFYVSSGATAHHSNTTKGGKAVFWRQAELIEMEEDAYQSTGDPRIRARIVALLSGVVAQYSHNWSRRTWNDDIMWMIIASVRAYQLIGDTSYRALAQRNFDLVYARAWSPELGGGLWWTTARTQKNVTTNATAAIAAAELATALHDSSYLTKAKRLYRWVSTKLYDPATGAVWDSLSPAKSGSGVIVNKAALTYNQGTFIGSSGLLYRATRSVAYRSAGSKALEYTKTVMSSNGALPAENSGSGNLLGFKGIFCRWAVQFVRDNHITAYDPWFRLNADTAWKHRNAQDLIGADWSKQTGTGGLGSWDCSSAVVLLEVLARR